VPFAPALQAIAEPNPAAAPRPLPRLHGHVLLAEDNAVNEAVAGAMLESFGLRVSVARNGRQALEALAAQPFDVVLMDCQMPEMDGFEATRRIRRREQEKGVSTQARQPIVAVTANAIGGDRERCLAAGMDDYLSKPFNKADLHALLSRWLPQEKAAGCEPPPAAGAERPAEAADAGFVDDTVLDRLAALQRPGKVGILEQVVGLYLDNSGRALAALRDALSQQDLAVATQNAHNLKSSSGHVGADGLSGRFAAIERAARAHDAARAVSLLPEAEAGHAQVCAHLRQRLKEDRIGL
jgi:CheY-like chemotaxis protein/HPt (histidine-containing phosphotransfer) domain-containing protein